nr:putative zinc-type alcohol dehydrogenase-like protein yoga [Quercus suber]
MPRAVAIRKVDGKPGQVYYPLDLITQPEQTPKSNQVTVRISAAALNHRDLFLRQHLYPGTTFGVPLLADGCGTVIATGSSPEARKWEGKRVVLNPGSGWKDDVEGPENPKGYAVLGGTKSNPIGTWAETVTVDASELEEAPRHLSSVQAAAIPLTGITAWRALMTKSGQAKPGRNILVTGIGGGVALMVLLFAVAAGANVYVTSGDPEKIEKAKKLGAKGGVNYKDKDWNKQLVAMLPKDRQKLDAIIDGAGADVVERGSKLLRAGGTIVVYGMTVSPKMNFIMGAVMQNIDVRGTTMGSRKEFADMVRFVDEKKLTPVISRTVFGLDNFDGANGLFEDMKKGSQFGKLVIEFVKDTKTSKL